MKTDRGSTLPLVIGFVSILLALTLGLSEVMSLRLGQDRVQADATFAATVLARDSKKVPFVVGLDYAQVVFSIVPEAVGVEAISSDGKTIRVRICENWTSPFGLHAPGQVCDQALARVSALVDAPA